QNSPLNALADVLGVPGVPSGCAGDLPACAERIRNAYGFLATKHILDRSVEFCKAGGKQLMCLLLCPRATRQAMRNQPRYDQTIVDHLKENAIRFFDMNLVHREDYKSFNLSIEDYLKRYYIGHYSPVGNHFFAYAVKDTIVAWLDPKPITYRETGDPTTDFTGYLPDSGAR
ncbi:unnamed protein product, partial [marine sediment metagenome]